MEAFLPDKVKIILLGLIAAAFVFARLARAFPDVGWLQVFRLPELRLTEQQKEHRRRQQNRMTAFEILLAGLVLPVLYLGSTVMMFNEPTTLGLIVVALASISCFSIAIWIFVRQR